MRGLKRDLWKAGMVIAGLLFLLVLMAWIQVSAAEAQVGASRVAATVTVQTTPTEDATVTALNKEKLEQEIQQLQQSNRRGLGDWIWNNAAAVLSSFLSTLVVVIGALIGFRQWRGNQRAERDKQTEGRFQSAVTGLGDDREGAKIGAAILLRTFL